MWRLLFSAVFAAAILSSGTCVQASYGHSAVVDQNGYPVFTVDKKPFFVYGAAFFYERLPKDRWRSSLEAYKRMGINTIDLYVIWNWHELSDGNFDFTGRTNPRRDLHALFSLIHELGFKIIVRPGPVIRNEWKNGGYPDWLLRRPEYNMPLHDILEGRYPATATLQNAHSDDAAAEWLANKTHITYATRWLRRVLNEIKPWSSDVIAVALDDDQGAYIDNQTWPAPHFQTYIKYLDSVVRGATSPSMVTFINTYQMKVTASSPVWAWGNWYQSDAYSIGEHDRSQLEFSTGLLQTQPHFPVMVSEFQAGWLQGPDENLPRPADPSNTELAQGTMLQLGAHGIVNFPVQDTFNPPGYEAPFANAFYAWDAALSYAGQGQDRLWPTRKIGLLLSRYGSYLAQTHRAATVGLIWPLSAATSSENSYKASAAAVAAQELCRTNGISCDFIDSRFASLAQRARYNTLRALDDQTVLPVSNKSAPDVVTLLGNNRKFAFLVGTNYGNKDEIVGDVVVSLNDGPHVLKKLSIPGRCTVLWTVNVPLHGPNKNTPGVAHCPGDGPEIFFFTKAERIAAPAVQRRGVFRSDVYGTGFNDVVLQNAGLRVVVSPNAGARAFVFEDLNTHENVFSTVGALRDDVSDPLPPSWRDYIAKYTHQMRAGTFNRAYDVTMVSGSGARFRYSMADAPRPVTFEKALALLPDGRSFAETLFARSPQSGEALSISALTTRTIAPQRDDIFANAVAGVTAMPVAVSMISGDSVTPVAAEQSYPLADPAGTLGLYDSASKELVAIWNPSGSLDGSVAVKRGNVIVSLRYPFNVTTSFDFGFYYADSLSKATTLLRTLKGR
jgi:hypothetical protein